jgi:hypothetical protein
MGASVFATICLEATRVYKLLYAQFLVRTNALAIVPFEPSQRTLINSVLVSSDIFILSIAMR